jgi:hypothetical protein
MHEHLDGLGQPSLSHFFRVSASRIRCVKVTLPTAILVGAAAVAIEIALGTSSASAFPAASKVKVASGSFHGVRWALLAQDSKSGLWCITLKVRGSATSTCDKLDLSDTGRSMSYFGHPGRPGPDFWAGPITSKANRVVLTYTDGRRVSVPTIPAPAGLARDVSFYVFLTPCRTARPKRIAGLDARARVVALMSTFPQRSARLAC